MGGADLNQPAQERALISRLRAFFSPVPALGWLAGLLCAVLIEYQWGDALAVALYLPKVPPLFGATLVLKQPLMFPWALLFVLLVYVVPICAIGRLTAGPANRAAAALGRLPIWVSVLLHLLLLYIALHVWTEASDYRLQVAKLIMVAVMLTLSLNVINGYMGEFSCSHPGFMALGAYVASVFSLALFKQTTLFGAPILPAAWGPYCFPLALVAGGLAAALGALVVAIPSFRTRGDYLAIISLAFMFIV
ncbi:MAG: branched-chain amino acid ABC transporter permease, partial [Desulfatitalea sp.]|nr:branched-chain amino acid ABC transporter permease [Desulfatitalea sp.]